LLPADVGDITELIDPKQFHNLRRVTSAQAFWHTQSTNVDANPFAWALISSRDFPGRWEIWLSGSGTTVRELNYMYNVRHDNLSVQELSTGTVNVTGDIATFSNTILTDRCVGSVLRVATGTLVPTSEYGRIERDLLNGTEEDVVRPGEYERIITAVTSTTTALLSSVGTTVANRGFTISSHIDVNYEGMRELFLRLAEEQYDIVTRAENVIQKRSRAIRIEAMRTAMAADGPGPTRPHSGFYRGDVILDENN
ncbi:MAG: hypothetical protein GY826_33100, partial [Fuerstiella sp.]|nr:hypothetical protein [Fuerstiella sp.]